MHHSTLSSTAPPSIEQGSLRRSDPVLCLPAAMM